MTYQLIIGNKAYSSWSLRPWLALRIAKIPFEEKVIPLQQLETGAALKAASPAGRVPVLRDGDLTLWESLAILEYLADHHPEAHLWPKDIRARAMARVVATEMHGGFAALRSSCPMNVRRQVVWRDRGTQVDADIKRIKDIWTQCRQDYGAAGPFLFGTFTVADAMYAPVVTRFKTYGIACDGAVKDYCDTILGLSAMQEWYQAALAETWVIQATEAA
ncbi:MAG: glutathione S-transferase family protein [Alphaproteobacteria bacterium]